MKANLTYLEDGKQKTIVVEAADENTIGKAVRQWRVNEQRLRKVKIKTLSCEILP
jgi:hypothetical protein